VSIESIDLTLIPGSEALRLRGSITPEQRAEVLAAFQAAWATIPPDDRDVLIQYWGQGGRAVSLVLIDQFPFLLKDAAAKADHLGRKLSLNPRWVFDKPVWDNLDLVLAHEIAHAYLFATDDPDHLAFAHDGMEQRAWDTLQRWNFDMDRHNELIRHVRSRISGKSPPI